MSGVELKTADYELIAATPDNLRPGHVVVIKEFIDPDKYKLRQSVADLIKRHAVIVVSIAPMTDREHEHAQRFYGRLLPRGTQSVAATGRPENGGGIGLYVHEQLYRVLRHP